MLIGTLVVWRYLETGERSSDILRLVISCPLPSDVFSCNIFRQVMGSLMLSLNNGSFRNVFRLASDNIVKVVGHLLTS